MNKLSFIHNYESELIGYQTNNCKTQSLGGSFTMHDPNLWVSLIWSTQKSVGLGTLKYMYRNFSYRGVYIWNKLQDHINIYSSYSTFSTALKTFLLSNDLNYRIT